MPYSAAGLNAGAAGIAAAGTRIGFHTADPGTTGANEIAGTGRPATAWGSPAGGSAVGSKVSAPIPGGTTVTHWSVWTAASGGTFLYGGAISQSESFTGAGTLDHTPTLTVQN